MKKSAYQNSKLKHQLGEKKNRGVKEVIWKLSPEQEEFVRSTLGYRVEACLYQVYTKKLADISKIRSALLKEIHRKCCRGVKQEIIQLTPEAVKILKEHNVICVPYKFKIYLKD